MQSIKIIAAAAGLAALAACGGGETEANNVALETENYDTGINATDPALNADLNAATDLEADANASLNADLNAANNAADANAVNAY